MRNFHRLGLFCALCVGMVSLTGSAAADTFGSGSNSFQIDFVTIGNPGNPADTTGNPNPVGAVNYEYRIGKYEISEQMIDKANALAGLGIRKETRGPDKPAIDLTWFGEIRFVNWLNTSTGSVPAYKLDAEGGVQFWQPTDPGYNPNNLRRNSLAKYFIPTVDEWYKAAYYDPSSGSYFDYPTGSNTPPVAVASGTATGTAVYNQSWLLGGGPADIKLAGGLSPYGTMAQGGNGGDEYNENYPPLYVRGASWGSPGSDLSAGTIHVVPAPTAGSGSLRVGSIVPEPSTVFSLGLGFLAILGARRRPSHRKLDNAGSYPGERRDGVNNGLIRKQIGDSDLQRFRQRGDHEQRWVAFAALDAANVRPMMLGFGGQLFLAPTALLAKFSQALAEFSLQRLHTVMGRCYSR